MPALMRRLLAPLTTPTPEELERWPVREDRPAKPHTLVSDEAERLDRVKPGWAKSVNKRTLNLSSAQKCVLGQVYGDFNRGLSAVLKDCDKSKVPFNEIAYVVNVLEDDWKKEIDYRLK